MKFLDKLGLALFSILILILSILVCLISFGWIDITVIPVVLNMVYQSQNGTYILIAILFAIIILAIKCLFFPSWEKHSASDDDEGILMQNENGKLLITKGTMKNIVSGVIEDFKEIQSGVSDIEINETNDVFINLSINVLKGTIIKDVSTKLQNNIKSAIKKATDLEIKEINIKVNDVETEEKQNIDNKAEK